VVRDMNISNKWDLATVNCAYTNKEEAKEFGNWKLNTIKVGMVLSIIGKAAYKVTQTKPEFKIEQLADGVYPNTASKLVKEVSIQQKKGKDGNFKAVLTNKLLGTLAGTSSNIVAVLEGGEEFANFATHHTFKHLRTA